LGPPRTSIEEESFEEKSQLVTFYWPGVTKSKKAH